MARGPIKSPEQAIEAFASIDIKAQRDARRRGLVSHQLFIKLQAPGDSTPLEILGVDWWCDFDGMTEHYNNATHMAGLAEPSPDVRKLACGNSRRVSGRSGKPPRMCGAALLRNAATILSTSSGADKWSTRH